MFIVRQAAEVLKKIKSQSSHKLYLSSLSVHVESSVVVNVSPGLEIRKIINNLSPVTSTSRRGTVPRHVTARQPHTKRNTVTCSQSPNSTYNIALSRGRKRGDPGGSAVLQLPLSARP